VKAPNYTRSGFEIESNLSTNMHNNHPSPILNAKGILLNNKYTIATSSAVNNEGI
jgi:hypothetical protein